MEKEQASKKSHICSGICFLGGKKDNFYLAVLEYFADQSRWFLKEVKVASDLKIHPKEDLLLSHILENKLESLVVDFPLTKPACLTCDLDCPGIALCPHPEVKDSRDLIAQLTVQDFSVRTGKQYENDRVGEKNRLSEKLAWEYQQSKSFKRRLKKGFNPYWNRPIDVLIWCHYYDLLLNVFNYSYDSFGNVSLKLMNQFHYLSKHFPPSLEIFESNSYIILIELYRHKIISAKTIKDLNFMDTAPQAQMTIINAIEKAFQLFVYEKDVELLVRKPKAFESFLLALVSLKKFENKTFNLAQDFSLDVNKFIVPDFSGSTI